MGWGSGTYVAEDLEKVLLKYVPKKDLLNAAKEVLISLQAQDWDCEDEVDLFKLALCEKMLEENEFDKCDIPNIKNDIKKLKKKFKII